MKKVYTRPEIFFESFVASSSIAGDCERVFTLAKQDICAIPDAYGTPGMGIFNMNVEWSECGVNGTGTETYDGLCYHVPTEALNLFNS